MKKFVVFLIFGLLASSAAWGANTAGININATVGSIVDVSVSSSEWAITVNNDGVAIENDPQGVLTVKSSKRNYTVTFSSLHNGSLLINDGGTETIPYQVKVVCTDATWNGVATNNLSGYTTLTNAGVTIVFNKRTPVLGKTFNIGFNIPAYTEYYVDGTYTDIITISIAQS